jgi:hypothetical protein
MPNMRYMYVSAIIIILIICIISYFVYSSSVIENFTNDTNIYLSQEEVINFIRNDTDKYINSLSPFDLEARDVISPQEYINKIINECYDFNDSQITKLNNCSKIARKFFDNKYIWKFALIGDVYEEGFPHTRADIIFISPKIINYNETDLTTILIHESIHIYQRYNKTEMNKYLRKKGYTVSRRRDSEKFIRANPDLDEYIYRDKNGEELLYLYKSSMPTGINDIIPSKNEHPFEIMAYEISEQYSKLKLSKYKDI